MDVTIVLQVPVTHTMNGYNSVIGTSDLYRGCYNGVISTNDQPWMLQ